MTAERQDVYAREYRRVHPAIARQHHNKSSNEAHIWHTKRCLKANLRGVLEELTLIGKSGTPIGELFEI
jgi:hypothetical protein